MILTPAQTAIQKDSHRFKVINCGRRFGKTTLSVNIIAKSIIEGKSRIAYIAPTYQQARDIAWEMLKKVFIGADFNESRLEVRIGNQVIQLRGWESIETLRGQKFDLLIIDEVASMRNFWIHWQEVIRPTLTDTKGKALFISTPKGFNHFYDLFNLESKDKDYKSFHFTSYDNSNLPKKEIDKAKEELPEDRFAQEYLADFRKTEGLVYKEFDRERHLTTDAPKTVVDTLVPIDWGHTNPAGVLRIRVDGDNHFWVDSEYYQKGKQSDQIIDYAKTLNPTKVYPDPAEADRVELADQMGLNVMQVSKDIIAGVDSVKAFFKQNRIHIHPDCKNLIHELETYHYPERRPDNNEPEKPVKEDDHLMDCLRYALHNYQKPQTNLKFPSEETVW